MLHRFTFITCLLVFTAGLALTVSAQRTDTIPLTLKDAEQLLLQRNIPLLMQRYSLDAAQAEVITAKLYDNPEVSFENLLYSNTTKKFFDFSYEGQNTLQIQQVFKLAGKRNKAIKLAQSGVKMTQYQFYDLLRTLRFSLRDNFYDLYYKQQSLATFGRQISFLQKIVTVFEQQQKLGNVAPKEIIRLKSLLYDLQHDQLELQKEIQQTQSDLAVLIREPATTSLQPQLPAGEILPSVSTYAFTTLLDTARQNRYDLKIATEQIHYNQLNLQLQQAMAVPDMQLGLSYDKQGNFERNYNGLSIAMPLPVFNRNQGNIKMAKAVLESSKLELTGQEDTLEHEVMNSYQQALKTEKLMADFDPDFEKDYTRMMEEVQKNFGAHNIGLLEFIDLYDAYRSSILKMNALRYERLNALESINFSTGTLLFHP